MKWEDTINENTLEETKEEAEDRIKSGEEKEVDIAEEAKEEEGQTEALKQVEGVDVVSDIPKGEEENYGI